MPSEPDFLSLEAQGRPCLNPKLQRLWQGVSCWETEEQAREMQAGVLRRMRYIAVLEIAHDGNIRFERTGKSDGHYTIWATPAEMVSSVIDDDSNMTECKEPRNGKVLG
ncbi:MAG: hypothetical protein WBA63_09630 [Thermomicrobiales bacterium]